jgi:hypothetical protein
MLLNAPRNDGPVETSIMEYLWGASQSAHSSESVTHHGRAFGFP